ncbi:MAG TPA: hypothetical protein VJ385_06410 [Fibrobacteria bacterium]|nr:hypothetical protein [Fibrobacteria bacterium]
MKPALPHVPGRRPRAFSALLSTLASTLLSALLSAGPVCFAVSCMSDGPSTETGNPNLQGTLRDLQGNPAAGTVKLFRVAVKAPGDTADQSALVAPTLIRTLAVGADGAYRFDSLPAALYALEGADAAGRNIGLVPGLRLATAEDTLKRIVTLGPPARIAGTVTRGPNALPAGVADNRGILVRLGGADRYAYSDAAGAFVLDNVPAGSYRLAFAAPDGHYEPKFLDGVAAASGVTSTIPVTELDWSRFQAPPAPAGLAVSADTAGGTVRLAWRAVKLANLDHYEVSRADSLDPGNDRIWAVKDTVFTDTVAALPEGRKLAYRVAAVNALGNRSAPDAPPVTVPVPPDSSVPAAGMLAGMVVSGNAPVAGARVRIYAAPASAGSRDSLPRPLEALDSALTGADGRYGFRDLRGATYTVIAVTGGQVAIRIGLRPRAGASATDTLVPAPTGSLTGKAARGALWVSAPFKGDEGISVSLSGTPYAGFTDYQASPKGRSFRLLEVPAGDYKLVVHAGPEGYFLPDTLAVTITAGAATELPDTVKARYNPGAPPPKIATLSLKEGSRAAASLTWTAVAGYPVLAGYRVLRLDASGAETARSAVLTAATYVDDVSALASGTRVFYAVRVVSQAGREGENGGDAAGQPVPFTVP